MDTLRKAIRRTVEAAVERGSPICISDEAKRLAELHRQEVPEVAKIASVLTGEALRGGVGVMIGEAAAASKVTNA